MILLSIINKKKNKSFYNLNKSFDDIVILKV